ncbi:hypothetical protein NMG60_11027130 [Bertholletia excelsa]
MVGEETKQLESESTPELSKTPAMIKKLPKIEEKEDMGGEETKQIESESTKTPAIIEKVSEPANEKQTGEMVNRDAVLARVATEKRLALVKAWEESEKTKAENKAYKKLSTIEAWENSKKANVEAELKNIEEKYEKKKAEYAEKMKNKTAEIHRASEEKKAMVEAKKREDVLKAEEIAAKFRSTGTVPNRLFGCFGC